LRSSLPDAFPTPRWRQWQHISGRSRLQWRDRAGLSPDFPFQLIAQHLSFKLCGCR
jgi:hypothetical protein